MISIDHHFRLYQTLKNTEITAKKKKEHKQRNDRLNYPKYDIFQVSTVSTSSLATLLELISNVWSTRIFASLIDDRLMITCIGTRHYHVSSTVLLVNSVYVSCLLEEVALLERPLHETNAGCFGVGIVATSLSSMVRTFDMVGRAFGSSCTHKSPTFTHFTN
jgi:hypothetical protein